MVGGQEVGTIKIELDMAIGETSAIESTDKGTMEDLVGKVRDLNGRLQDIRREQVFQRVSWLLCSTFRYFGVMCSANEMCYVIGARSRVP